MEDEDNDAVEVKNGYLYAGIKTLLSGETRIQIPITLYMEMKVFPRIRQADSGSQICMVLQI